MKINTKAFIFGAVLSLAFSPSLLAKESVVNMDAVKVMELKLANLEVSITEEKVELFKRKSKLNEMKVKSLYSEDIDKKQMAQKLAEVRVALSKDELLLLQREVKLYEMKASLLKHK